MSAAIIIVAVLLFLVVLFLFSAIKVAREYERGIIFRLGRLLPAPKGPEASHATPLQGVRARPARPSALTDPCHSRTAYIP